MGRTEARMTAMNQLSANPKVLAEAGEKIYKDKFQYEFELEHLGKFAVIDIGSQQAFVGNTPEEAYKNAIATVPKGLFHLIKIGSAGAYRVSYASNATEDWLSK
jgi:hypothetical protein